MKYVNFYEALKGFTCFSINDIKTVDNRFYRTRLNEWQKKGYIKKVINGYYVFSNMELSEYRLFEIANIIYSPSYISFEMAFSYYHLIPESVYEITSVSTRRTYKFVTPLAEFNYRTLKPELFFGYELVKYNNKVFKMASIEKAILDYFYINSHIQGRDDFISLRINKGMFFELINQDKFYCFLNKFSKNALSIRVHNFLQFLKTDK